MRRLRKSLLTWFAAQKRDLPWRRRSDAYAIWLSEVMLQQTRVSTVIPYYERFLQQFPDVFALAEAPLDEVLTAWSGLGYYRRARLLHQGAQHVASELGGEFPQEAAELQKIPGIGAYTSGAIASIAYGTRAPAVDGNVERVLCRLVADPENPRKAGKRGLWARATQLVDPDAAGDFNQALMELGATVCSPRSPSCTRCPWRGDCAAHTRGEEQDFPKLEAKLAPKPRSLSYLVVRHDTHLLLFQRGAEGRFAGLWEPLAQEHEQPGDEAERARALAEELGLDEVPLRPVGGFEHVLSHLRYQVSVHLACLTSAVEPRLPERYRSWIWHEDGERRGLSRLAARALELSLAVPRLRSRQTGE